MEKTIIVLVSVTKSEISPFKSVGGNPIMLRIKRLDKKKLSKIK